MSSKKAQRRGKRRQGKQRAGNQQRIVVVIGDEPVIDGYYDDAEYAFAQAERMFRFCQPKLWKPEFKQRVQQPVTPATGPRARLVRNDGQHGTSEGFTMANGRESEGRTLCVDIGRKLPRAKVTFRGCRYDGVTTEFRKDRREQTPRPQDVQGPKRQHVRAPLSSTGTMWNEAHAENYTAPVAVMGREK